jgi:hypothetical protein
LLSTKIKTVEVLQCTNAQKNIAICFDKYETYKMFSMEFMKLNDVKVLCTESFFIIEYVKKRYNVPFTASMV